MTVWSRISRPDLQRTALGSDITYEETFVA